MNINGLICTDTLPCFLSFSLQRAITICSRLDDVALREKGLLLKECISSVVISCFLQELIPNEKGGKTENGRIASPKSLPNMI